MSSRLEMLQVARLAKRLLGESADNIEAFLAAELTPTGFKSRDGTPDPYYSVFGVDCLHALQLAPPPPTVFRDLTKSRKDLMEVACLARLSAGVPGLLDHPERARLAGEVLRFRRPDGGFAPDDAAESSTVFASFLGVGALQDLSSSPSAPESLVTFVLSAALEDGGFALAPGLGGAMTPTTAAAVNVLHQLGGKPPPATAAWLAARASPRGGFVAGPGTAVPDLLSTAVALHALATLQRETDAFREPCLDFVDTLWSSRGGFFGHWADDVLDCEYTFYGLLALGHLA